MFGCCDVNRLKLLGDLGDLGGILVDGLCSCRFRVVRVCLILASGNRVSGISILFGVIPGRDFIWILVVEYSSCPKYNPYLCSYSSCQPTSGTLANLSTQPIYSI